MLGGAYLCFEGAEKIYHMLVPHDGQHVFAEDVADDPAHLEEQKAAGAIKTDFILSAEIMTIALAAIPVSNIWMQATALAIVGTVITIAVYGTVALIVKADDVGLYMVRNGRWGAIRWLGRALVLAMPGFMALLTTVGTAAMLWVGGAIVIHCMEVLGFAWLGHHIHDWAATIGHRVSENLTGAVEWVSKATMNGVFGLALGLTLIPFASYVIAPAWQKLAGKTAAGSH
jgi:predicted DNA repair protein MutK